MRLACSFENWSLTIRLRRFDVDEDISDPRIALLNGALHIVGNPMAVVHRDVSVHADVKIDIKAKAYFADEAFFNFDVAGSSGGRVSNAIDNFSARRRVHDFVQGGVQQSIAIGADERTGEKRGPIVGALPTRATNERNRNANEGSDGSHGIGAMVPGIGLHGGAFNLTPDSNDIPKQSLFH